MKSFLEKYIVPTHEQPLKKHQNALLKTQRCLDRERAKLRKQEVKIISEIRKLWKDGQVNAVKTEAKNLIETRRCIQTLSLLNAKIQAASMRIQTTRTLDVVRVNLRDVAVNLRDVNRRIDLPELQKLSEGFEKAVDVTNLNDEVVDAALKEPILDDVDEEESCAVLGEILEELGLGINEEIEKMPDVPTQATTSSSSSRHSQRLERDVDAMLLERLDNLRKW